MDSPEAQLSSTRRVITRPTGHRPGAPAPWADLPQATRRGISLRRVEEALGGGDGAVPEAGTERWRLLTGGNGGRPAAVLVALFEEEGEARVVLTVRSDRLRAHQGEVAFPGGRLDGDETVVAGALREASEEVGLDPAAVAVVAELSATPTMSSGMVMTPVVATLGSRPELRANPDEVERVFDVALSELAADRVFTEEWWSVPGRTAATGFPNGEFPVWFFDVAGEQVWGATARTLVELLCRVLGVDPPLSLRPA